MNNNLRTLALEKMFRYFPFIHALFISLNKNENVYFSNDEKFLYRGTRVSKENPLFLEKCKINNKNIMNIPFLSFSQKEEVDKYFLINKEKKNVLLKIKAKGKLNINLEEEKLSDFPGEKEVLILPFCYFKVINIEYNKKILDKNNKYKDYYEIEL